MNNSRTLFTLALSFLLNFQTFGMNNEAEMTICGQKITHLDCNESAKATEYYALLEDNSSISATLFKDFGIYQSKRNKWIGEEITQTVLSMPEPDFHRLAYLYEESQKNNTK